MNKNQRGFTIVELMVTVIVFMLVMVAASNIFSGILNQYKQQSKIAETNIEGAIGLQLLQLDIEKAGYGLPWSLGGAAYTEAGVVTNPWSTPWTDRDLNDGPPNNPARGSELGDPACNPPGAIRSLNNANGSMNNSDVLSIKAANIATNSTAGKFGYITNNGANNILSSAFGNTDEDLTDNERVIVMSPVVGINQKVLQTITATNSFFGNYNTNAATFTAAYAGLVPGDYSYQTFLIYGVSPIGTDPSRPFNRADYYVRRPAAGAPSRCQTNTGALYKAVLSQTDNTVLTELPLLDCVADMQVIFALDSNTDGTVDTYSDNTANLTASDLRNQLKEVRVYIVAHEGQRDPSYTYTNPAPVVGCTGSNMVCINDVGGFGLIKAYTVPDRNYRWKLYSLIVKPYNLR